jgi:hypothetical protein
MTTTTTTTTYNHLVLRMQMLFIATRNAVIAWLYLCVARLALADNRRRAGQDKRRHVLCDWRGRNRYVIALRAIAPELVHVVRNKVYIADVEQLIARIGCLRCADDVPEVAREAYLGRYSDTPHVVVSGYATWVSQVPTETIKNNKEEKTMVWKETVWANSNGTAQDCILVSWGEAEAVLGHAYDGNLQDLASLKKAALSSGAPDWVSLVEIGDDGIDEDGVYLINPA